MQCDQISNQCFKSQIEKEIELKVFNIAGPIGFIFPTESTVSRRCGGHRQ
jgi:hypothetical protein